MSRAIRKNSSYLGSLECFSTSYSGRLGKFLMGPKKLIQIINVYCNRALDLTILRSFTRLECVVACMAYAEGPRPLSSHILGHWDPRWAKFLTNENRKNWLKIWLTSDLYATRGWGGALLYEAPYIFGKSGSVLTWELDGLLRTVLVKKNLINLLFLATLWWYWSNDNERGLLNLT